MPPASRFPRALFAVAMLTAVAAAACGGQAPESAGFVVRIGADTVVMERYTRTRDSLVGEVMVRPPGGAPQRLHYRAALGARGEVTEMAIEAWSPGAAPELASVVMHADSAGAVALLRARADTTALRIPTARGAIPVIDVSIAHLEAVVRRARESPGDTVTVPLFMLTGARTLTSQVVRLAPDTVRTVTGTDTLTLRVDPHGRILAAGDPARRIAVTRVDSVPARWFEVGGRR